MITIKNYNSDVGHGTFYGWDMKYALEDKDFYSFEFEHRNEQKRVYVLVHRNKLKSKNLDAIVVNKIGDFNPISSDYNQIDFINSDLEITSFEKKLKIDVSSDILNQIIKNVKEA